MPGVMTREPECEEVKMPPDRVILFIIGTIVVLFGAYYVTYFIGMKASGQTRTGFRNRNINVLDRYAIARDKQFCVIEIAGKVYFVGITNHTMTLLDTYDATEFAKFAEDNRDNTPWNMTPVGQYGNKLTRKVVSFIAAKTGRIPQDGSETDGVDFAESLKEAQDKHESGLDDTEKEPSENQPESHSENPEGD